MFPAFEPSATTLNRRGLPYLDSKLMLKRDRLTQSARDFVLHWVVGTSRRPSSPVRPGETATVCSDAPDDIPVVLAIRLRVLALGWSLTITMRDGDVRARQLFRYEWMTRSGEEREGRSGTGRVVGKRKWLRGTHVVEDTGPRACEKNGQAEQDLEGKNVDPHCTNPTSYAARSDRFEFPQPRIASRGSVLLCHVNRLRALRAARMRRERMSAKTLNLGGSTAAATTITTLASGHVFGSWRGSRNLKDWSARAGCDSGGYRRCIRGLDQRDVDLPWRRHAKKPVVGGWEVFWSWTRLRSVATTVVAVEGIAGVRDRDNDGGHDMNDQVEDLAASQMDRQGLFVEEWVGEKQKRNNVDLLIVAEECSGIALANLSLAAPLRQCLLENVAPILGGVASRNQSGVKVE
ncbi:hypothetical protein DL93DRAFT_2103579 [Clavulina sp. PMI_390]|nr:hypothetical protein DL93DRAFT_2103579 [Clavulina sp. PMI_390]